MRVRQRIGMFGVPAAVIVIVVMLVVPLPSFLLDLLISINISAALIVLLMTMHVDKARDFSGFPSLLLIATMFRLAINVSVTRLVLLHGYAGAVVEEDEDRGRGSFQAGRELWDRQRTARHGAGRPRSRGDVVTVGPERRVLQSSHRARLSVKG